MNSIGHALHSFVASLLTFIVVGGLFMAVWFKDHPHAIHDVEFLGGVILMVRSSLRIYRRKHK